MPRSTVGVMQGLLSHERQGIKEGALLWINPQITLIGLNDVVLSLGLGHCSRFIFLDKTTCYYLYYDLYNLISQFSRAQPLEHGVSFGVRQVWPKTTMDLKWFMNVKLLRDGELKTLTDYERTLPDACTLSGTEFKFSRRFGKHSNYLISFSVDTRFVVYNAFQIRGVLDNTLYSQKTYTDTAPDDVNNANNDYYLTTHSMLIDDLLPSLMLRCDFEYQYNRKIRFVFHVSQSPGVSVRWSADGHDTRVGSQPSLLQPVEHCMLPIAYHPSVQKACLARKHAEHFVKTGYTVQEETLADHFVEYRHNRALQLEAAQRWSLMNQIQRKTLVQSFEELTHLKRPRELPNELIIEISRHVCDEKISNNTPLDRIYLPRHNIHSVEFRPHVFTDNADYSLKERHVNVILKHWKRLQHDQQELHDFMNFKRDPVKLYDERLMP